VKKYIDPAKCSTFASKRPATQRLIQETLAMLEAFGIPMDNTPRRLERMAVSFLACCDVTKLSDLTKAKDANDGHAFKTREIIVYVNKHFDENISSGSYDDIRRKDLKLLVLAEIIIQSNPNAATNDSTRGYSLNPLYAKLVRKYGAADWNAQVKKALKGVEPINDRLQRKRNLLRVPVKLPSGKKLLFSKGEHNDLQKAIIEEFLPRFGFGAQVLYVGDTSDKYLHLDAKALKNLGFVQLAHEELPDIIAHSTSKNWLLLIEAVHTSGPISEIRLLQLQKMVKGCKADVVYVTAFLNRAKFRQYVADIAWETEVWIADNPDHMVHFNGDKFMGPYKG
jgi:type II restriction enzyme